MLIGAASEGPGFKRFDAAAKKSPIEIGAIVRRDMESALHADGEEDRLRLPAIPGGAAPECVDRWKFELQEAS